VSRQEKVVVRRIGWVSLGVGVAALGIYIGRELRARWNYNHRSPYDFYSHSGEEIDFNGAEAGVGV
jgi:hypothetical protein